MNGTDVGKRVYYILTREEHVREMLADYRLGKQVTEEKLEKRKRELCRRYQLHNLNLDSYSHYFERGYCCLCQEHGLGSEIRRERHFQLYHDAGLRGDEYEEEMNCLSVEETLWEKKLAEAMEMRRKMVFMGESAFLERNRGDVQLVTKRGARDLGVYKCIKCDVNYTSSVDAMERHLESHESKSVIRYYRKKGVANRFQCAEQNFRSGKCWPGPSTILHGFIVGGVKYTEGSKWKCSKCSYEIEWCKGVDGRKVSRVIEKVEEHLTQARIRGHCDEEVMEVVNSLG